MKIQTIIWVALALKCQLAICQQSSESKASIKRQIFDINPDGSYTYAFETENQIFAEEQGYLKEGNIQVKQGQYQYTAPNGEIIRLAYIADETGFHPQGSHLPVA